MFKKLAKSLLHNLSGNRRFYYRELEKIAQQSDNKIVLELGSGKQVNGKYIYSAQHLFPNVKEFIMTDINPEFGHQLLDVSRMNDVSKYDIVLCLNVLEHVFEFRKAVDNAHRSLRPGGLFVIAVPFVFPLHDEPHDYWRFTEHSLRKLLEKFTVVEVFNKWFRLIPSGYIVVAKK